MLMKVVNAVIQGGSDMGHRLSEDELQKALDFCGKLFVPTTSDEYRAAESLASQVANDPDPKTAKLRFMDIRAPLIDPQMIETVVREQLTSTLEPQDFQSNVRNSAADSESSDLDVKKILEEVNARRVIHPEQGGVHNFEDEPLGQAGAGDGWVARLEKGKLGLNHVHASAR